MADPDSRRILTLAVLASALLGVLAVVYVWAVTMTAR